MAERTRRKKPRPVVPLDWELVSGRTDARDPDAPCDPRERYGVYRVGRDGTPELIATGADEGDVGMAVCTLGREGEFKDKCVGVLDRAGAKGERWLALPWAPMDNL